MHIKIKNIRSNNIVNNFIIYTNIKYYFILLFYIIMELETDNLYTKFSGVIELTSKDFNITKNKVTVINKEFEDKNGFINFYAPWCPHCKKMVEMWSDLAIQFKHKFIIAAVNCEKKENYEIRNKLRIREYPTIKFVSKNGLLYNHKNGGTKDDFIYFICNKL